MKKVLILTTVSGFLYKFELDNVEILQSKGYEVHYAANGEFPRYLFDENVKKKSGVIFHHICIEKNPAKVKENLKALQQIMMIIKNEQIQVLHCHTPMGGVLGRLAGRKCEKKGISLKVIYTAHGFHFYQGAPGFPAVIYKMVEKYLAQYTDLLITINEEDYNNAKKFKLKKSGKVYQIPGVGLDMKYYIPATEAVRQRNRNKLGILENQVFLLSVGEINKNKNHRVIIEALRKLQQQGQDLSKLRYAICGDGVLRQELGELVRQYQLEQNVFFYDYQKDVRDYLWAADIFLFPSRREGLGMAALEALSTGLPVIAADNRGSREYIQQGKNGFLCEWNNSEKYIEYIQLIMKMPLKSRNQMKEFCRASAEPFEKANTNKIMKQVYELL